MASIAAARCDGTILLHHGLIDHPPRIFTNLLSQVLGVMVSDGRGAHGMEIEEEEDEFEQNGPTDGPANQSANTATAAAASDRATHCQTCGACFCEQGGAALAHHKRNCKPTYTFIQQGELSVELVFERTAMREVGGAPEACCPNRVRVFECTWCPPGSRTYSRGTDLGTHLRKSCAAAKQQKFVLPTPAPIASPRQPTTAATVPQSDRRKRGRGKVRACVCVCCVCVCLSVCRVLCLDPPPLP